MMSNITPSPDIMEQKPWLRSSSLENLLDVGKANSNQLDEDSKPLGQYNYEAFIWAFGPA